jgi:hypothetical protein|uniref:Uncharacterized protein n=2 Tax=Picea TaxID=3328 RepID=A0A101M2F4_PICGL|nr:hypothetical protein ABT39_MTgene2992 [Picea glauca]QHR90165.1 hypothetical protein Q903MT_gene4188 [Picea sitchensis]QHR91884.1 hypothetical protein Q903MT_gene5920 [Picea sitchensis]
MALNPEGMLWGMEQEGTLGEMALNQPGLPALDLTLDQLNQLSKLGMALDLGKMHLDL